MPKSTTHSEAQRYQEKITKLVPATEKYEKPVKFLSFRNPKA